jgi:flagellar hook protein FlgE
MMGISTAFNTSLSGLTAIETDVNVIGDNIANAATTGFKQSTVAFATQLAQTWRTGFSPSNSNAGTNPMQVGLGTEVASITPDLTQGSIYSTGIPSDLAIDGNGYFLLQNFGSRGMVYTRDGEFHLNSAQDLTNNPGQFVMGYGVDANFQIVKTTLTPLNIPLGSLQVAQQTKNIQVAGSLSPQGVVATNGTLQTGAAMTDVGTSAAATGGTLLSNLALTSSPLTPLFAAGQTIDLAPTKGGQPLPSRSLAVTATTNVADLENFIGDTLGLQTGGAIPVDADGIPVGVSIDPSGQLVVKGNRGTANDFDIPVGSMTVAGNSVPISFTSGANRANGESAVTNFTIYDSQGAPLDVRMAAYMESQGPNQTTYRYTLESADQSGPATEIGNGTLTFDSQGNLVSPPTAQFSIDRSTTGAVNPMLVTVDLSQIAGLNLGGSALNLVGQDGARVGTLTSYSIDDKGIINGVFDNGITRTLGQVALAIFPNAQGLVQVGDNNFAQGVASGLPAITTPGVAGTGALRGGSLEQSNTDLGENLVNLITASNTYQGNARAIDVNSHMFDALLATRK